MMLIALLLLKEFPLHCSSRIPNSFRTCPGFGGSEKRNLAGKPRKEYAGEKHTSDEGERGQQSGVGEA
jgi:hypothetical protein